MKKNLLKEKKEPVSFELPIFEVEKGPLFHHHKHKSITNIQGCKFSDFCLISENFTSKCLKMFFEISSLQPFLDGFRRNSDFQTRSVYHFRFFQ